MKALENFTMTFLQTLPYQKYRTLIELDNIERLKKSNIKYYYTLEDALIYKISEKK